MKHLKSFLFVVVGIFIGYFFTQMSSPQVAGMPTTSTNVQPPQQCPQQETPPPCPCLFSDKILEPPKFKDENGFATNFNGEARLAWLEKVGAKKYKIFIEDQNGKEIKTYQTPRTILFLKDIPLPEGIFEAHYQVRLASVNGKDEVGPKGEARPLHIKPQASVVAPKIQEIRVED